MRMILGSKIFDGFLALKMQFYRLEKFIEILVTSHTKIKYATPLPFSVMHFDSAKGQTDDEYVTVAQLSQRYPAFTQGSIRWLIFNANSNGFSKVIRRIGRKVVLSLSAWKAFLDEQIQK